MQLTPDTVFADFAATEGGIGVAVSGGSDSVALLLLMQAAGVRVHAVTVDHHLRDGSAEEARAVAALCKRLEVPHTTLDWTGQTSGNLQADARAARYGLIANWARATGIGTVALGHTQDDQAETVLMRLRRGSGVDGLSAMRPLTRRDGVSWWRPLLGIRRQTLRDHLRAQGVSWIDDPSNTDDRFERVRMRKALAVLEPLGLDAAALAGTAQAMQRARDQLEADTLTLARAASVPSECGAVRLNLIQLVQASAELRLRLLAHALCWVAAAPYRPRLSALESVWADILSGRACTLHGCLVRPDGEQHFEITREISVIGQVAPGQVFDRRWRTDPSRGTVGPVTDAGLAACPDWRTTGHSRAALAATPALWRNGELHAAPFAGRTNDWQCCLKDGTDGYFMSILTH